MIHPNEYLGAGQGLAVPTKVIKQADVVMMLNLFKDRYSQRSRERTGSTTSRARNTAPV
jgi:trehalose/maltose hydrolase-like predicted phosphorylase